MVDHVTCTEWWYDLGALKPWPAPEKFVGDISLTAAHADLSIASPGLQTPSGAASAKHLDPDQAVAVRDFFCRDSARAPPSVAVTASISNPLEAAAAASSGAAAAFSGVPETLRPKIAYEPTSAAVSRAESRKVYRSTEHPLVQVTVHSHSLA